MFSSLLVANRGEIALRVIRTARRMGLRTIAVYSDADRQSLHAAAADEAFHIGSSETALSYLNASRIVEVAVATGAQAVHPGYGFLSENADFAEASARAGIIFVGPPPEAIRSMGLKDEAKSIAEAAGVPTIPGYRGADQSLKVLVKEAERIGFPIIIKAIAGGGGRGMRIVESTGHFSAALEACRREAKSAFGDDRVLLERYFASARHVEVQVLADNHGNVIHLYERDCSIQRRHQKIIEEAPAYGIPNSVRAAMQEAAIAIARKVNYRNAGTVEFLYDPESGKYFFMEMNTRLQVEHPVTEMITGLDLVELQLCVAAGEKLAIGQRQLEANGHAIEARLYAEDPAHEFLPQTGVVRELVWPAEQPNCRIDAGIAKGSEVESYYDPLIAKVIAWGDKRHLAIDRLRQALDETILFGLRTNKGFLLALLENPSLTAEAPTTRFLDRHGSAAAKPPPHFLLLGCMCWLFGRPHVEPGPWSASTGWMLANPPRRERHKLSAQGREVEITSEYEGGSHFVIVDGQRHALANLELGARSLRLIVDGRSAQAHFHFSGRQLFVDVAGYHLTLSEAEYAKTGGDISSEGSVRAPMPGKVLKLEVSKDSVVRAGARLLVLEAMKMEHILLAPLAGRVADIYVAEAQQVREGDLLCSIKPE
jgi:3-methylcrotonyl-CoA carboxylase alpha subunit